MLKITEYEFGDILLNSAEIQKLIKTNHFLVAREFKVGSAVPDFVLVTRQGYDDIRSLSARYPSSVFRGIHSSIISILYGPTHTRDIDVIARANFVDKAVILKAAKMLDGLGIIKLDVSKSRIARTKDFYLPRIDVISLELKLDKWKKALWQASRNQAYYASSYVVMPSDKESLIRQNIDFFTVNGVSAVVVDTVRGGVKFVSKQKKQKAQSYITTQRLTGLSYLMQGQASFVEVRI